MALSRPAGSDRPSHILRLAALASLILLLLISGSPSSAQIVNCAAFRDGVLYVGFEADNYLEGDVPTYSDSACTSDSGGTLPYDDGLVYASEQSDARAICDANNGEEFNAASNWFTGHDQNVWLCEPGQLPPSLRATEPPPSSGSSGARRSSSRSGPPRPTPTPKLPVFTGVILNIETNLRLSAVHGLFSGIQFQRVDAGGVGIKRVIDLGLIDAVDVWANIGAGYTVCFPNTGYVIFLDAAGMPRAPEPAIDVTYTEDDYTCAFFDRAGTVVLVERLL